MNKIEITKIEIIKNPPDNALDILGFDDLPGGPKAYTACKIENNRIVDSAEGDTPKEAVANLMAKIS